MTNYEKLAEACKEGNFNNINEEDILDADMIYDLALNAYVDNYDENDSDEDVEDWLNDQYEAFNFVVKGNKDFDGSNAEDIVKIANLDDLQDKGFYLDGSEVVD